MKDAPANTWSTCEVGGHPCEVFRPAQESDHGYVVIYLHGVHLGKLRDHAVFTEEFSRHGLKVVCPVTQRSWWTDRICPEFDQEVSAERHVLERVLPAIEGAWGAKTPQIALMGTSMGGQGALRLAYRHPDTFPIAAAISPAIDYQNWLSRGDDALASMYRDEEEARQDTAILHVHPLNWPRHQWFCCDPADFEWFDSCDRLRMKLSALGVPHECDLETTGGGHSYEYYTRMAPQAISFVANRLERERLRIV